MPRLPWLTAKLKILNQGKSVLLTILEEFDEGLIFKVDIKLTSQ